MAQTEFFMCLPRKLRSFCLKTPYYLNKQMQDNQLKVKQKEQEIWKKSKCLGVQPSVSNGGRKSLKCEGEFSGDGGTPAGVREQRRETASSGACSVPGFFPLATGSTPGLRKCLSGWAGVCRLNEEGQAGTDAGGVDKSGWSDLPRSPGCMAKNTV